MLCFHLCFHLCFLALAVLLELAKERVILHESTVDALLIETGEVEIAEFGEESPGVDEGGSLFRFRTLATLLGEEIAAADGVDSVLMGGGAVETPGVADDAGGDLEFLLAGGFEVGGEAIGEAGEGGLLGRRDDGELAGEVVLDGVEAGDGLAFRGARAGGPVRVGLVGGELPG